MSRFSLLSSFLIALSALSALGCSDATDSTTACTEIGCGSAFSVTFSRAGAWPAGAYTVDVTVDGVKTTCSATIPLSCSAPAPCPDGSKILLGLDGCALSPQEHKLSGVEFEQGTAPKSIEIVVSQDGAPIGNGAFTPTYTTSRPNGGTCEPECKSAPGAAVSLK